MMPCARRKTDLMLPLLRWYARPSAKLVTNMTTDRPLVPPAGLRQRSDAFEQALDLWQLPHIIECRFHRQEHHPPRPIGVRAFQPTDHSALVGESSGDQREVIWRCVAFLPLRLQLALNGNRAAALACPRQTVRELRSHVR